MHIEPVDTDVAGLRLLIGREQLHRRVSELGAELREVFGAGERPVLVSVLKGATLFLADLVRAAGIDCEVEFMSISSYGSPQANSGTVRIEQDLSTDVAGRHVLVVEDIIDTGLTLNYLLRVLRAREPETLRVCTLLDKDIRRIVEMPIDHVGFAIPDVFVIGYGLDYAEEYRHIDAVYVADDLDALAADPRRFADSLCKGPAWETLPHADPPGVP